MQHQQVMPLLILVHMYMLLHLYRQKFFQLFLKPLLSYESFKKGVINLKTNSEFEIQDIVKKLIKIGYKRVATTYEVGQFSVRGEVIDGFPCCSDRPIRINFDFDTIETIKYFNYQTQFTEEKIEQFNVMPVNEIIIWDDLEKIKDDLKDLAIKNVSNFVPAENEVVITKDNFETYLTNSYLNTTKEKVDRFSTTLFITLILLVIA